MPPGDNAHTIHSGMPTLPSVMGYGEVTALEDYRPGDLATTEYMFGCGQCHPMDPAKHRDGIVQVEVSPAGAPTNSLRSMNDPNAAYSGTIGQKSGSCSGVACHSTGQKYPTFKASPPWNTTTTITCDACHANPPSYPSGGAGTDTANTHMVISDDGYVLGHFAGFMGAWYGSNHGRGSAWGPGGADSAPITCQTCHFESVDPTNVGPSGFYYLDTSGTYTLPDPNGGPAITSWFDDSCGNCHTGQVGAPAKGVGRALALRHVNGRRDVVFDPRETTGGLTGYTGAPSSPNLRPYWWSNLSGPPGVTYPGNLYENPDWSTHLKGASYDSYSKTCSNVGCHLRQGTTGYPLVWGRTPVGSITCDACHGYGGY
jgi:predicted CxxxxCH...CXXCH cytochrome family protein